VPKSDPTQLQRLFYDIDRVRVRNVVNGLTRTDSTNTYKGDREMSVCEMQKEFRTHELDFAVARYTMERALVLSTRELATGIPTGTLPQTSSMPPSAGVSEGNSQAGHTVVPPDFKPRLSVGIGGIYCNLLATITTLSKKKINVPPLVKTASAGEVVAQGAQRQASQQPTAQQPAQQPGKPDSSSKPRKRILMGGSTIAPVPIPTPARDTNVAKRDTTTPKPPPNLDPSIAPVATPNASGTGSGFIPPRGTVSSAAATMVTSSSVSLASASIIVSCALVQASL